jgi:predicted nucleotidyltransferase
MTTVLSKRRRFLKETLRQRALVMTDRAATTLYAEGAEEVYVFGSVLKPGEFNENSDVDIAVQGVSDAKKAAVTRLLEDIFDDMPFDLVFLDEALRPEVRRRIGSEGIKWKR